MIKKEWFLFGIIFLILAVYFAAALTAEEETAQVTKAYSCLGNLVDNRAQLTLEEAAFSVLALGEKEKAVNSLEAQKSAGAACWPNSGCKLKETALAALAYNWIGRDTSEIITWLESRSGAVEGLTWYLQIITGNNEADSCTIRYGGADKTISINDKMKIEGDAGSCLSKANGDYWLKISNTCLNQEFKIYCTKSFNTNLLYQKSGGGTVYVSSNTHSASGGGETIEKVSALCLKDSSGNCDYEGTLWGVSAIYKTGGDASGFEPYLLAFASENKKNFPSAFLYLYYNLFKGERGADQYQEIINDRIPGGSWKMTNANDLYYDTAIAMWALGGADDAEIRNGGTVGFLLEGNGKQTAQGCWNNNNLRDTAFILFAGWPQMSGVLPETTEQNVSCVLKNPAWLDLNGDSISSAVGWASGYMDGSKVYLEVEGSSSQCIGKNVVFKVYEDKQIDELKYTSSGVVINDALTGANALFLWEKSPPWYDATPATPWLDNPKFYFNARIQGQSDGGVNSTVLTSLQPVPSAVCGDGNIEENKDEVCECGNDKICGNADDNLNGESCVSVGYDSGDLACDSGCLKFKTSGCVGVGPDCGDGSIKTGVEVCDCGADGVCTFAELNNKNCSSHGFDFGTLGCGSDCKSFNTGGCVKCGNGLIEGDEKCDGTNLSSSSCVSLGFDGGALKCSADCKSFNTGSCTREIGGENGTGNQSGYNPNVLTDCEAANYFCTSGTYACVNAGGRVLDEDEFSCLDWSEVCCTEDADSAAEMCYKLGGEICTYDEECSGSIKEAADGACCLDTCEPVSAEDACANAGGTCKVVCGDNENELSAVCSDSSKTCCASATNGGTGTSGGTSWVWWIVLLVILIVLVIIGIIYKDKLRVWWFKRRGKAGSSKVGPMPPFGGARTGFEARPMQRFMPAVMQRRMMPAPSRQPIRKPTSGKDSEFEDTMKKLKEMSK